VCIHLSFGFCVYYTIIDADCQPWMGVNLNGEMEMQVKEKQAIYIILYMLLSQILAGQLVLASLRACLKNDCSNDFSR